MARTSDLSGEALSADHAVRSLTEDGKTYQLDLTDGEAIRFDALEAERQSFIDAARGQAPAKTSGRQSGTRSRRTALASQTPAKAPARKRAARAPRAGKVSTSTNGATAVNVRAIRDWARVNGHPELGERGRVPTEIVVEYEQAHQPRAEAVAS